MLRVPGTVHLGQELVADAALLRSPFYRDWLAPQDLFQRLGAVLMREGTYLCELALFRSRRDPPFGEAEQQLCRTLAPHLRRAVQVGHRFDVVEAQRSAAIEALDRLATGVLLCDNSATIIFANRAGRDILEHGDALAVHQGRLKARDQNAMSRLLRLLSAEAGVLDAGQLSGGTLLVPRAPGLRPLALAVSSVRMPRASPGPQRTTSVIFINDPGSIFESNASHLLEFYGLTPSEARLAIKITEGRSIEEAAAALKITTETARTYVKRILAKTGAKRQSELIRLVIFGSGQLLPPPLPPTSAVGGGAAAG